MSPSEKMAARAELVPELARIDDELLQGLTGGFGAGSLRAAAEARYLLKARRSVCGELVAAGYQPWEMPTAADELKAV